MESVRVHNLKDEFYEIVNSDGVVFNYLQHNILEGLWYCNLEKDIKESWLSNEFWATLGYKKNEIPKTDSDWQNNDLKVVVEQVLTEVIQVLTESPKPFDKFYNFNHKTGQNIWIYCHWIPIRNDDGKLIKIIGGFYNASADLPKEIVFERGNKHLTEILANTGDIVFILDKQLEIIEIFNRDLANSSTFIKSFQVGNKLSQTGLSDSVVSILIDSIQLVLSTKQKETIVFDIEGNSKEWYEFVISGLIDTNGELQEILCVVQNITKHRGTENLLLEKTRELDSFFTMGLDLLCITDQEGRFIKVNKAWEDKLGYNVDELKGNYYINYVYPEDISSTKETIVEVKNGKNIFNFINRFRAKDGSFRYIEWHAKSKGELMFAAARDISESKQAVEDLKTTKDLLQQTSEVARVGGWEVDFIKNKVVWSSITKEIYEVEPEYEPLMDTGINFYKDGQDKNTMIKVMQEAISYGKNWDEELEINTAKGNNIWIRIIGKVEMEGDTCKRLYGTLQDITESKLANQKLEKALADAKQAAEAKSAFLSNMSHEIRTPLNAVIGMTHLLLEASPRPDQYEKLNTLRFSGDNLLALVNDILDYSKIESGKVSFENIPFNIYEITHSLKQTFAFKAQEKGLKVKVQLDSDIPEIIKGDPTRLVQLLNNLMGNALKFTEKGKVSLSIELMEELDEKIVLLFEVRDTGIGISNEKIDKIFERFTQANESTTREFGGTGLGLSIVKKLLELQNSKIEIESEEGKGTCFSFKLCFNKPDNDISLSSNTNDTSSQHTTSNYDLSGLKVLLAEDNAINQMIATEFLTNWNVNLDYAINGIEAIEKVTNNDYDVVLMDIQMPDMDGYQAALRIKEMNNEKANIPILAMTASAMLDVKEKIKDIGMEGHILKPFNPKELNTKLAQYIKKNKV
ncbi:ATP-binding protein [Chondrinema litorale]|uniref:ATP-binding protein n=1 Tax=Chondrinema litorale TaxID=2994555 RepID=UPI0025435173|nr:ATP-binding protein [Chondrinema litorale]UZR98202.1 ATP-binding protein [Chondrinema litorale]